MDIKNLIEKNRDYIIEMRRYFHQHPELSYEEFETTKRIAEELDKMGIPYQINDKLKTGIVACIKGGSEGKTVALRSDIDALNVNEVNTFDYVSKNPGKMHACGHDAHIATLLGAAKILNEVKDQLHGKVYLIFQPAEELGTGAQAMIDFGDWYKEVDNIFGAHIWSNVPVGTVAIDEGPRMAATDKFDIRVIGRSGHGSAPHETIDATVVASSIVMNLQTLVSRHYSPLDPVVVTVGSLTSGYRFNIISGEAKLSGTVRYFSKAISKTIADDIKNMCNHIAAAYGAKVEVSYDYLISVVDNEPTSTLRAKKAIAKILGEENVGPMAMITGGEDFASYLAHKPGCFALVGGYNPKFGEPTSHHSPNFMIDDSGVPNAAGVYAQYAIDFLNEED